MTTASNPRIPLSLALLDQIMFPRVMAEITGSVVAGLFLFNAYHWTKESVHPQKWFVKTVEDWQRDSALTSAEQEWARARLRELGLLDEEQGPVHYYCRVNKARLDELVEQYAANYGDT